MFGNSYRFLGSRNAVSCELGVRLIRLMRHLNQLQVNIAPGTNTTTWPAGNVNVTKFHGPLREYTSRYVRWRRTRVYESCTESPLSEEVLSCARIKPVKAPDGPPDYRTVRQRKELCRRIVDRRTDGKTGLNLDLTPWSNPRTSSHTSRDTRAGFA